jgi:hypothetical protein
MSYIINNTDPFVSVKLTEKGRERLALGQLNFAFWAIGDSEINYGREAIVDANQTDITLSASSKVLRPVDRQPNIKYFITPINATSQYQNIDASNMNVVKAVVNNEATERGFFTNNTTSYTTNLTSSLTPYSESISGATLSGGTSLTLTTTSGITIGDYLLIKPSNDILGNLSINDSTSAIPNLWFKAQNVVGNVVTVDRNLPNYSAFTATTSVIVYRGGEVYESISTGNTTAYWDSGTLSFNSNVNITCDDVPVWNMNNVWCENMAGMSANTAYENYTKFGSYQYLGTKNPYLEYLCENSGTTINFNCNGPGISYPDDVSKSISIIHYTNNAISSLYGEFLYVDATSNKIVTVSIPNMMYHRRGFATGSGTTMGMTFIASGATQLIGTSDIQYIDLIEHPDYISANATPMVVGKVFPQYKMIVFDDDEIVAAMSYKSNRNWTLPPLAANIIAPSGGTSTGVLEPNQTIYLTYSLENTAVTGLTSSLPCQYYIKVTNNTSVGKDIAFRIAETDLLPYMRKIEDVGYDGYGFYANSFKLLYQIVDDSTARPDPSDWKVYDFTSTGITTTSNATIDPVLLENQTPGSVDCGVSTGFVLDLIKDSGSTSFDLYSLLNMAPSNQPSYLQFGDERFFYGNLQTFIGATIYKTIFDIRINGAQFNTTTNPTRSTDLATNPPTIRVTDVGIYDSSQNLVCIGKLSTPVKLNDGNTIMLELSLDF